MVVFRLAEERRLRIDVAVYFNRGFVPQRLLLDRLAEPLGRHASVPSDCLEEIVD